MSKRIIAALIAMFVATSPFAAARAELLQLKFASPSPPGGQINDWGLHPWIKDVEAASDGTLEIKFYAGVAIANFGNIYDRIVEGVVDLGFGVFGPLAGQFPKTDVSSLPFETDNATESSVALWRLLQDGLIASEYTKVKPLALVTFSSSGINTKKEIKTIDDLRGLRMAAFARSTAKEAELLGAAPISMTPSDAYQSAQRGLVDGIIIGLSGLVPFKYQDVVNFHLVGPLGQTNGFVFMNKDAYAKLPPKAKAAIDRYAFENFALRLGQVSDRMEDLFSDTVAKLPGHKVYRPDEQQTAIMKQKLAPIADDWIKATPNGEAVLAGYRAELAKFRASRNRAGQK